jgi:enterochelin esterase-like enzyme
MLEEEILERHEGTLHGRLKSIRFKSNVLGIGKSFYVYEPPYFEEVRNKCSHLYLFRGHQREFVNIYEDTSRKTTTTIEALDQLIVAGIIPPCVMIMPGLNSANNHVPSLGIDMVGNWDARKMNGLGTGKFWQFLSKELFPYIDQQYPLSADGLRLAAGFSLGGYTVSMLAAKLPAYFHHVGMYDGTMMWAEHNDPRTKLPADGVWQKAGIFDPALGNPRNVQAMSEWNSTDLFWNAEGDVLEKLKQTTYWIASAAFDGMGGNRERCEFFADLLHEKGLTLGFNHVVLDNHAQHNWFWNNVFVMRFVHAVFNGLNV